MILIKKGLMVFLAFERNGRLIMRHAACALTNVTSLIAIDDGRQDAVSLIALSESKFRLCYYRTW